MKVKVEARKMTHYLKTVRILIAVIAVAALALGLPAAPSAQAAGLTNCVDLFGRAGACYELVWVNGVAFRMTFAQEAREFPGARPSDQANKFYVIAPQTTSTPQGALPFPHDHVVGTVPGQDHGDYSVLVRGYFVLCTEQGMTSSRCVPTWSVIPGLPYPLPLAKSVDGQALTSAEAIEAAGDAGLTMQLDTGATFLGIINPGK